MSHGCWFLCKGCGMHCCSNRDGSWESGYGHLRGIDSIDLEDRSHFWFADKSYPTSDSSWDGFRANLKLWARVAGNEQEGRL